MKMRCISKERQSNIELLRIITMMGVVILHYNNPNMGGGMKYATEGSINFYLLYFLESCFVCSVNLFVLISGYFLIESKTRNIWKVIELIAQVMCFSFGVYVLKVAFGSEIISLKHILGSLIPSNYFVILYSVVFLVSPFVNKLMKVLDKRQLKRYMVILVLLFSVYPTAVDLFSEMIGREIIGLNSVGMYGSQWGYTAINFILMYCVGAYIRINGVENIKKKDCILTFMACVFATLIWSRFNDYIGYFTEKSAYEYCNPLVILMAVAIFIVFAKTDIGTKKWINNLAKGAFTVYLTHGIFISHVGIQSFVQGNTLLMITHIIAVAVGLYLLGYICFAVYDFIMKPIWKFLENKFRIPKIEVD